LFFEPDECILGGLENESHYRSKSKKFLEIGKEKSEYYTYIMIKYAEIFWKFAESNSRWIITNYG